MKRKGQGLSITTIIVAAIALIVLVILIAIFTGRIAVFQRGISEEANAELARVKINYGDCHPSASAEGIFLKGFSAANDEDKAIFRGEFNDLIDYCNTGTASDNCPASGASASTSTKGIPATCSWK